MWTIEQCSKRYWVSNDTMRYAHTASSKVILAESPSLTPGSGDMLVKMAACGICGSDLEKVYGQYGQPSIKLGHEPAGTIKSVGERVQGFVPGDRVFTHHHVPCYACYLCKHGNETRCPDYSKSNISPCGISEEYLVPEWNVQRGGVLKLPDTMSFEEAALIEPVACCLRAWTKCRYMKGDSVAIFGMGFTGMTHAMLAMHNGLSGIYCVDTNPFRLEYARGMGVTQTIPADVHPSESIIQATDNRGVDLAVVATGNLMALSEAISSVRYGGTVMMFGVPSKDASVNMNMDYIYTREITISNSYAASDIDTANALKLIQDGKIDVASLVTHSYDISDTPAAFEHARSGQDTIKVVVTSDSVS